MPWRTRQQWSGIDGPLPQLRVCCGHSARCSAPHQLSTLSTGDLLARNGLSGLNRNQFLMRSELDTSTPTSNRCPSSYEACTMSAKMRAMCEQRVGGCCNGPNCAPAAEEEPAQHRMAALRSAATAGQHEHDRGARAATGGNVAVDMAKSFIGCSVAISILYFGLGCNKSVEEKGAMMRRSHGYARVHG